MCGHVNLCMSVCKFKCKFKCSCPYNPEDSQLLWSWSQQQIWASSCVFWGLISSHPWAPCTFPHSPHLFLGSSGTDFQFKCLLAMLLSLTFLPETDVIHYLEIVILTGRNRLWKVFICVSWWLKSMTIFPKHFYHLYAFVWAYIKLFRPFFGETCYFGL